LSLLLYKVWELFLEYSGIIWNIPERLKIFQDKRLIKHLIFLTVRTYNYYYV